MFARSLRPARAISAVRLAGVRAPPTAFAAQRAVAMKRSVTTDAASSHADNVPAVGVSLLSNAHAQTSRTLGHIIR